MTTEDEWAAVFKDLPKKPDDKDEQDWSLPETKPVVSPQSNVDWKNLLKGTLTGTPQPVAQQNTTTPEWSLDFAKVDPAVIAQYEAYTSVLTPYEHHGTPEKSQFLDTRDPNLGYKVHLNVLPENVVSVSEFLKNQGYEHKYLHGGEVEDGKVFTVYLGSKAATEKNVREIYNGVGTLLELPKAAWELEYAPRIVGRFRGSMQYFRQYGRDGISALNDLPIDHPQNTPERARQKALELYGEYFGGGITPYKV